MYYDGFSFGNFVRNYPDLQGTVTDILIGDLFTNRVDKVWKPMESLYPAFFAFTGMRTEIGLVSGMYEWLVCGLIIAVASAGKFGGSFLTARATGLGWRQAAALGSLMNTRGLMKLIVLNVGLELGVISQTLFTMLVLMALATTLATTPIVQRLIAEDLPAAPQRG